MDRRRKGLVAVSVVTVGSAVVHLALFIGGMMVALMLRHRDRQATLLTALGFGCVLLSGLIAFGEGFGASRIISAAPSAEQIQTIFLIIGIVIRLVELAGLALIFFGLLRVMRPVAPWTGVGR